MRSETRAKTLRRSLFVLAVFLALGGLWIAATPSLRSWRVKRQIARFERNPSQTNVASLVRLLEDHTATSEQGQRILTLLRRPSVTTRPVYSTGYPIVVCLKYPYHLHFRTTLNWHETCQVAEGEDQNTASGQTDILYLRAPPAYEAEPGNHQFTVRVDCRVKIRRYGGQSRLGDYLRNLFRKIHLPLSKHRRPMRIYRTQFDVPVAVTVAAREDIEAVKRVSSPQLDQDMRSALSVRSLGKMPLRQPMRTGRTRYHLTKEVCYQNLPMSAAFKVTIHLSDEYGRTISLEKSESFVAQGGRSGKWRFSCWFENPGIYTGTAVLTPDLDSAYGDLAIEEIWNGTVELPILFEVPDPNRPQPAGVP